MASGFWRFFISGGRERPGGCRHAACCRPAAGGIGLPIKAVEAKKASPLILDKIFAPLCIWNREAASLILILKMDNLIYLDNNATTPVDERVLEAMLPYFSKFYGNAASNHKFGLEVKGAVKKAREQISSLIGCDRNEIIFTSGATEAINLGIKGVAESYRDKGKHIITVATEHYAVLDTCKYLEKNGFEVTYLPVLPDGLLDFQEVEKAFRPDTILVCVMYVNNETGVIQPIEEIANLAHEHGALFMTDATQAIGKIPINVRKMNIDLLAFSGHKFYGPKGIGALYVQRSGRPRVNLLPLIHGGGHEKGMRSGTLNVPGIVGLGKACEIAESEMEDNEKHIREIRDYLETELLKMEGIRVNGNREKRLYNVSNILFEGVDADAIIMGMENVMVSTGSACTSHRVEPSHVLLAMGLSEEEAFSSLRLSFSIKNRKNELKILFGLFKEIISNLRSVSHVN